MHQMHYGKKFYLDKKTGYWISTTCPHIRAHVWVWKKCKGEIEKGFHIHHKDGNKSNNSIENLEKMSAADHLSFHSTKMFEDEEFRKKRVKHLEVIRPLTKKWHRSKEGAAWHKKQGKLCWDLREPRVFKCGQCDKQFKSKTFHSKFCSGKCKSKWRRVNKLDYIEAICPICEEVFTKCKYSKTKTCGRKCGGIFKSEIHRGSR